MIEQERHILNLRREVDEQMAENHQMRGQMNEQGQSLAECEMIISALKEAEDKVITDEKERRQEYVRILG